MIEDRRIEAGDEGLDIDEEETEDAYDECG